jgi:hypothetical protein
MNVLTIFRTRNIVKKFAWKILNVFTVRWVGIGQVHCPCTHDVFTMYRAGKLGLVPSEYRWTLDLSLELTAEEGESILGTMYPHSLDEFDALNRPGVWESLEDVLETEERLQEILTGLD